LIVNKSIRIILLFIFFLFSLFIRIRELHASNLYIMHLLLNSISG
jgi:hypothetical protein